MPYKWNTLKKLKQANVLMSVGLIMLNTYYVVIEFRFLNTSQIVGAPKKNQIARMGSQTAQPAEDKGSKGIIGLAYK